MGTKSSAKRGQPKHADADGPQRSTPEDALGTYRNKRDPALTTEPFEAERPRSGAPTLAGRFVVHLHDATNAHYDLRLELGGTLRSFAVPKGPSLDPADRRLAIQTENHPLEYASYEDVIPPGQYGAGPMIVWDTGQVRYLEGSAEDGDARGKLDFELYGFKLRGRFGLVATGRREAARQRSAPSTQKQWLLIKKIDLHATPGRDVTLEQPHSVLSGLAVDELERRAEIGGEIVRHARELGAVPGEVEARGLVPMLCASDGAELDDPERIYELKLDGVRVLADRHGNEVVLRYRNGRAITASWPEVERAVKALPCERALLDGEIVTFDERGRPNFQRLLPRVQAQRAEDVRRAALVLPVVFVVFDLLALGDLDLRPLPLLDRKRLLTELVRGRGVLRALDHLDGDGRPLLDFCHSERLEGLVAKRAQSPYRPGPRRTADWVKVKCERDDDFVVVGWVEGKASRKTLGALDLASWDGERFALRGKVGSGLDDEALRLLPPLLESMEVAEPAYAGLAPPEPGLRRFVRPGLVVSVRYLGWSEEGRPRFPVFRGVRPDIDPKICTAAPPSDETSLGESARSPPATIVEPSAPPRTADVKRDRVVISNRNKVFWPEEGFTKGDLCDYYAGVADVLVPFLRGRPVVLVRYPDGIEGKSFYQWRVPEGTPSWVRTMELGDGEDAGKRVFLVDHADALLFIVNLGCIPLHVLGCTEGRRHELDFITIDLDLGEQPLAHAVRLALSLKDLLQEAGLRGYPKTSGQSGLHVLVPVGPGIHWESGKLLCELLGRLLVARHPDLATMERKVDRRGAHVYVDTGQTGRSRTIVAPYSVRAHRGATVSTPLAWDEVHLALDPSRHTLLSVPARVAERGDPMAAMLDERPDVAEAVRRLGERL